MSRRPPKPVGIAPTPRFKTRPKSEDAVKQSLTDLFRTQHTSDDMPALLNDITNGTDRTACIILSAMIERDLEQLILTRIEMGVPVRKNLVPLLFERDGPLASFNGNIDFALVLQLITQEVAKKIHAIRRIRNAFAHSALPVTFATKEIIDELRRLKKSKWLAIEPVSLKELTPNGAALQWHRLRSYMLCLYLWKHLKR